MKANRAHGNISAASASSQVENCLPIPDSGPDHLLVFHGPNAENARQADEALDFFAASGLCEDPVMDLLCDLMHWCAKTGNDFNQALRQARSHYRTEGGGKKTA